MHEGSITIRIRAEVNEIERLNRLVRHFGELLEIPSRALYAVNLAVDELVTNAILYGFEEVNDEEITIRVEVSGTELQATVIDEGHEFDPLQAPAPNLDAPLQERSIGGLGVHLVRNLMDHVAYTRDGAKNVLTVRKRIR
jgi:anti-sigma regulatory factor (Ser/Thr protein kinase)